VQRTRSDGGMRPAGEPECIAEVFISELGSRAVLWPCVV
jgi:hypothetical protein